MDERLHVDGQKRSSGEAQRRPKRQSERRARIAGNMVLGLCHRFRTIFVALASSFKIAVLST